ncbi:hypothetical protein Ciccas_009394 [Cichlidogyrus casuarinus]|uniref:cystathionine gamma-lyase n=1 Tax=Cichlidogyrus casuarinus TaxID=1844966 RepID=A0ABD2PYK7_9PLAT
MTNLRDNVIRIIKEVDDDIHNSFCPFAGIETDAAHVGHDPDVTPGVGCPVITPISLSTTFKQQEPGVAKYDYSRGNNYTREALENNLAALEKGDICCSFASGLAAINVVLQALKAGDHFICFDDLYGGTGRLFREIGIPSGITHTAVDMRDLAAFESAFKPNTKMVWIETPSNPLMRLVDMEGIVRITKSKDPNIFVVVDNTFMSPYFQRPIAQGADVVMHSLTKYVNGHGDVVMGALIIKGCPELQKRIRFLQFAGGAIPSPFDCYLALRGIRSLAVRMKQHMKNGLTIAKFLETHPKVEKVIHPGLKSHPQYELGKKQMIGYSGMIAVYIKGNAEQTKKFIKALKIFCLAESLGGFESLAEIPYIMTHASVPEEIRQQIGITENLVRLSVGLEDVVDLAQDLDTALNSTC